MVHTMTIIHQEKGDGVTVLNIDKALALSITKGDKKMTIHI